MQTLTFQSKQSGEQIKLSFGHTMSTVKLPPEEKLKFLETQINRNLDALTQHYNKYPGDIITLVSETSAD